jgi:hypothetical protein
MANPAYVQSAVNEYTTSPGGATSDTQVVLNGTTAGNTVVLVLVGTATASNILFFNPGSLSMGSRDNQSPSVVIFNDCFAPGTINSSIAQPITYTAGDEGGNFVSIWMGYATKIPGGNLTIYPAFDTPSSGTWTLGVYAFEISGTTVFDTGAAASGASAEASTGAFTTANPNDIIISVSFNAAKVAATSESYTLISNTTTLGATLQYITGATAGSQTANATYAASQDWCITAGAFGNPTPGPPYIVQYTTGAGEGFQSGALQTCYINSIAHGNLLVAAFQQSADDGTQIVTSTSISDTNHNVWYACSGTQTSGLGAQGEYSQFYYAIAKQGSTTVTIDWTGTGASAASLFLFEIAGANAYNTGSAYENIPNGSTDVCTSGTFNTGYSNVLVIGFGQVGISQDIPGYNMLDITPGYTVLLFYGNLSQPGSQAVNITDVNSLFSQGIVAAGAFYLAPYLPNDPIFFGIT